MVDAERFRFVMANRAPQKTIFILFTRHNNNIIIQAIFAGRYYICVLLKRVFIFYSLVLLFFKSKKAFHHPYSLNGPLRQLLSTRVLSLRVSRYRRVVPFRVCIIIIIIIIMNERFYLYSSLPRSDSFP